MIRRCDSSHTEESIREDLEHIHNLAVLGVDFNSGNCFIKTNSVHNAMYARTCMMSRLLVFPDLGVRLFILTDRQKVQELQDRVGLG